MKTFKRGITILKKILGIVIPFGKRNLVFVGGLILVQGVIQVMGIFSILPFLALAANPEQALESQLAQRIQEMMPFLNEGNLIFFTGIATLILLLGSGVVNLLTDYQRARYAQFTAQRIAVRLLRNYAYSPYEFHLLTNSAALMKKLHNDVHMFMIGVLLPSLETMSRVINVFLIVLLLLFVAPGPTLVAVFGFASVMAILLGMFRGYLSRSSQDRNKITKERYNSALQLLTGIKQIMVHECQAFFINRFQQAFFKNAKLDSHLVFINSLPRYLLESVAFSGVVGIVLFLDSSEGDLTEVLPLLGLFALAGYRILPSLNLIYSQITSIQSRAFTIDTLREDLHSSSKLEDYDVSTELLNLSSTISFEKVSFSYSQRERIALDAVSLKIAKGNHVGIVGSSGSGKSTLIDLLLGLHQPASGQIIIDDEILTNANISGWRKIIGYVPQEIFLTDDTVRRNIALGISDDQIDDVRQAAEIAQIHSFIETQLPNGYETIIGEHGARLSGGQRQRIALARALYRKPQVLIFDEATSALDSATEKALMDAVAQLPSDMTVIMVAHRLSTIRQCDRIFVLDKGHLVAEGQYEELLRDNSTFRKLALQK
jgi:ABC-type multidrug transport system fused ATPase/permease subunit